LIIRGCLKLCQEYIDGRRYFLFYYPIAI